MNSIITDLENRQLIKDIANRKKLKKLTNKSGVYVGFDPSASSLHLGNYLQIALLKRFQNKGFGAYALVGGATGMIGDPSGKAFERTLLNEKQIALNKQKITHQLKQFGFKVVDNYQFYQGMSVLQFLRNVGKSVNVSYLLSKEFIKKRVKTGLSFAEFAYQLIQGWDYKVMYERFNVRIQLGASDQWGNITTGLEFIRKLVDEDHQAIGIMTELITNEAGEKFGKSEGNAIWLDKNLTSPYQLYQYLFNSEDQAVEKLLLWLTFLDVKTIKRTITRHASNRHKRIAQKLLAYEVTKDIHSKKEAEQAQKISSVLFGEEKIETLKTADLLSLRNSLPTVKFSKGLLVDALISTGAAISKRQARELIVEKAIEVNGKVVSDSNHSIKPSLFNKKVSIIKKGKRNFYLLEH
ncbi:MULTISPECIES: tyrosine--tRNA ligase [unclassified Mycoplasma]|uniref:tyrosine--tRNA ligase n=1 Tax=unclassified Mycoplasma TaxID=2683645 RepID=UPI000FDE92A2